MKTKFYLLLACLSMNLSGFGQRTYSVSKPSKIGIGMNALLKKQDDRCRRSPQMRGRISAETAHVLISCTDSKAVQQHFITLGITSVIHSGEMVTAEVPLNYVRTIASFKEVRNIDVSQEAFAFNHNSRKSTEVDKILVGDGLITPYTGKGVIVGIIDKDFQFNHPAFRNSDGTSRIVYMHNRFRGDKEPLTDGKKILKEVTDGVKESHGTHVLGIAAGSRVKDVEDYGMAPEATLMVFPSKFRTAEILEDVKTIRDYAKKHNMPWVVNMSFGATIGAHGGMSSYDKTLSSYVGDGGFVVAAMGNDANQNLHITKEFEHDNDTCFVLLNPGVIPMPTFVDVWIKGANDKNVTIQPFAYDIKTHEIDTLSEAFWYGDKLNEDTLTFDGAQLAEFNNKLNIQMLINFDNLQLHKASDTDRPFTASNKKFGLYFIAPKGTRMDSWLGVSQFATWVGKDDKDIKVDDARFTFGDHDYNVGELAASSEKVVAVGSYNTATEWTTYKNEKRMADNGAIGEISNFSSRGPQRDNNNPKPTVVAPGSVILSAYNDKYDGFSYAVTAQGAMLTQRIFFNGEKFFYGEIDGTSMASPAVTGIIALWLEAYPKLTYDQLMTVLRTTSKRDEFTGTVEHDDWNRSAGYGKIDAYEGLKAVLKFKNADPTGLFDVRDTQRALTIKLTDDACKLLFNNDESFAEIQVFNTAGMKIDSRRIENIASGQEETVSFATLPKGIYVVSVRTAKSKTVQKIHIR
ncbi:S8 family peptidase [Prevotella sp. HUN102]|uniref:S8 family peptidase n=1 Tax=Prevotella sp. HUN102 TaxID=1392486 RepID=UPI00048F17D9|nr:S8 family peptidase [Prevotella sp. HUN102]